MLFHLLRREFGEVRRHLELVRSLAEEEGFPLFRAGCDIVDGWLCAKLEGDPAGIVRMREGLEAWQRTGTLSTMTLFLGLLAELRAEFEDVEGGLELVHRAQAMVQCSGERFYEPDLHRLRGELMASSGAAGEGA